MEMVVMNDIDLNNWRLGDRKEKKFCGYVAWPEFDKKKRTLVAWILNSQRDNSIDVKLMSPV